MKAKFLAHGADIFDTYELLEMLLYNVIPYKDTNPVSKRLLAAFGSLDGVLSADRASLIGVDGIGERTADYLTRVGLVSKLIEIEPLVGDSIFSSYHEAGEFFVKYFNGKSEHKTVLLLLDNNLMPISLLTIANEDCESAVVKTHAFITAAIRENASAAIISHNHPFTAAVPLDGDVAFTHSVNYSLSNAGISLLEHFIISGSNYCGVKKKLNIGISAGNDLIRRFFESRSGVLCARQEFSNTPFIAYATLNEGSYEVEMAEAILAPLLGGKSKDAALSIYMNYFSFERALSGTYERLSGDFGEKCAFYLKLAGAAAARRKTDAFAFGSYRTEGEIVNYFKALFIGEPIEKLYVMSFDEKGRPTACDLVSEGTVNETNVLPRKILEIAIKRRAARIALAHNHPRGSTSPSREDSVFTERIGALMKEARIEMSEHYVIAGNRCKISFKSKDC